MKEVRKNKQAAKFAKEWKGRGYERGETQIFWMSLLRNVFGIDHPEELMKFEERLSGDKTSFMDVHIPSTRVLIEQKSLGKNLNDKIRQSDGRLLTPYQQAKQYIVDMGVSQHPLWVVTCNFREFHIHDMESPGKPPEVVKLEDLENEWHRLQFLVDKKSTSITRQTDVSIRAGRLIGDLYKLLREKYKNPDDPESQKSLNKLCVRLVFCLYAEDTDIFGARNAFHDYLVDYRSRPGDFRRALIELFRILDTPFDKREYVDEKLNEFPYVNGGLFSGEIEIPMPDKEFIDLLLDQASMGFNWRPISPTIFGSVFESTLNPETRRSGGMHYTSVENIHKVIDPLFLNDLRKELDTIIAIGSKRQRRSLLADFRRKLAGLSFLDPACGSGNFLTETYISLRRLENEALRVYEDTDTAGIDFGDNQSPIMVRLSNFHGIEINDFAVSVAETALWIAESQMLEETMDIVNSNLDLLPLKNYNNIVEGNALTLDWNRAVDARSLSYIIGNPPFNGGRTMSKGQKADLIAVLGSKWKDAGNLDFVAGWYKKSLDFIKESAGAVKAALVSTNSICQGEQVAPLWKPLLKEGIHIDFAHQTFRWDSESTEKAHVHCVIVGFSLKSDNGKPIIYDNAGEPHTVKRISPYLLDLPDILVESRTRPLCNVPGIGIGNQPIDNGNYLFSLEEKEQFIKSEPQASQFFHPWYGAEEFINRCPRYCLWLGECSPAILRNLPNCLKRVEAVRSYRLRSKRSATIKLADKPTGFQTENIPDSDYLLIPSTSSERRAYIPIGYMPKESMASNAAFIVNNANVYHFGVLTSRIHMAWVRVVGGRLKSDYRYSKDIIYNNFPWPEPTQKQKADIESTAKAILKIRDKYPDCSLADLYDDLTMPYDLREAHRTNDKAVAAAYGLKSDMSDIDLAAHLLSLYDRM